MNPFWVAGFSVAFGMTVLRSRQVGFGAVEWDANVLS